MHSRTREWLKAELNKQPSDWDSINPFHKDSTCMGMIALGKGFYQETQSQDDLTLWETAVDKAAAYVANKEIKYEGVAKQFKENEIDGADEFKEEKDEKTHKREKIINDERKAIQWEKFLKIKACVKECESIYNGQETAENLAQWQKHLSNLVSFAEMHYGLVEIHEYRVAYDNAYTAHQEKYSFAARAEAATESFCYRLFKCFSSDEPGSPVQIQESNVGSEYRRM